MAATPSRSTALALVSIFVGAVLLPRLAGWAQPDRIFELSALALAAIAVSCLRVQGPSSADRAIMPPAFLVVFAALLLLGPLVAMTVAAAAALAPGFTGPRGSTPLEAWTVNVRFGSKAVVRPRSAQCLLCANRGHCDLMVFGCCPLPV